MNKKLEEFKKEIVGKNVAVIGIGVSNIPLIKYLYQLGADITAFDKSDKDKMHRVLDNFKDMNIKYSLGNSYLDYLCGFDIIFRSPGIRYDIPEFTKAIERGAKLTSEMEVFLNLCPAKIIAVTGSDGKTTTTTLIYEILKRHGYKCWLGGNIGTPLLDRIDEMDEEDKVILELSSFQLQTITKSPDIAVVTNVTPNHLDYHKSMEEYIEAKKNILAYQSNDGKLILNYDNDITRDMGRYAKGSVMYFSMQEELESGAFVKESNLIYKEDESILHERMIINKDEIIMMGKHNVYNYLAAILATIGLVDKQDIYDVATTFKGVEHRIEFVREINNIKFYNDSIASSPARTIAGLNSFSQKVILIAGGYDKKIPYDAIAKPILEKVKCLILIGQTADKIAAVVSEEIRGTGQSDMNIIKCESLEEATHMAYKSAIAGDVVLLSPASASFDMFKNFEERGKVFKKIVEELLQ